jgi:hypothetical protein
MEVLQETNCVAIFNKQKMTFFLLLFLYKIGELENRTGSAWEWRVGINGIE